MQSLEIISSCIFSYHSCNVIKILKQFQPVLFFTSRHDGGVETDRAGARLAQQPALRARVHQLGRKPRHRNHSSPLSRPSQLSRLQASRQQKK